MKSKTCNSSENTKTQFANSTRYLTSTCIAEMPFCYTPFVGAASALWDLGSGTPRLESWEVTVWEAVYDERGTDAWIVHFSTGNSCRSSHIGIGEVLLQ